MTIKELYDWAVSEGFENYTIIVRDTFGSTTWMLEPTIDEDKQEVEL